MDVQNESQDDELSAIQGILKILEPFDEKSKDRIYVYVRDRIGVRTEDTRSVGRVRLCEASSGGSGNADDGKSVMGEYESFAELHDAAQPNTDAERVLIAAYWLQECEGESSFVGYSVNRALKDLGHGVSNVTNAIDKLKNQKPALVIQLKKSGKSKQARKTYKVTAAGNSAVSEVLSR